jgi:T5SS/PEP-CTERM-associated repeat protein
MIDRSFDSANRRAVAELPKLSRHSMRNRLRIPLLFIAAAAIFFISPQPLYSAATVDPNTLGYDDVSPSDPIGWTSTTTAYVGATASGELTVDGGSSIYSNVTHIGYATDSTGTMTVDGIGSNWIDYWQLYVGGSGIGTLDITESGAVRSFGGNIGQNSGSTGTVTVDGIGSNWINSDTLVIGNSGHGILNVTNGGSVSNSYGYIGRSSGSTGTVTVDGTGSTWTNSGKLTVGDKDSGTLDITNGGLVSAAGTLTIDNNLDNDSFINLATGGMLALYGDADDSLTSFLGIITGSDNIRYWDDSILDWAHISGATWDDYTLQYMTTGDLVGYTMLTVGEVPISILGDCNCDGMVNTADLAAITGNWQQFVTNGAADGDLNGDGQVTTADLAQVTGNWQAGVTAVPEPSTLAMLALGGLMIGGLRMRRRNR